MVNIPPSRMTNNTSSSTSTSTDSSSYPYPANLNISNFVSLDLTPSNYCLPRTQIRKLNKSPNLEGLIDGDTPLPIPWVVASAGTPRMHLDQPNLDYFHCCRFERLVHAWLTSRLKEETL